MADDVLAINDRLVRATRRGANPPMSAASTSSRRRLQVHDEEEWQGW